MKEGRSYRVLETLGEGGFGVVYRAEISTDEGFTKQVAIKVIRGGDGPEELVARLRDEARILGLIRHRAIVRVDGLAKLDLGWAVIMEYIDGLNLDRLVKLVELPPSVALEVVEEVASLLHTAYAEPSAVTSEPLHMVHRDIKPANIRVTPGGEVKVFDLGAARADFANREAVTRSWRYGTPRYMAPERFDGIEGPASDIYATGKILAELLAHQLFADPPTNRSRHDAYVREVLSRCEDALSASEVDPSVRADIVRLVADCIAYDPDPRPVAADVVTRCRDLRRRLQGVWLRTWAEREVKRAQQTVRAARSGDPTDARPHLLVESSGTLEIEPTRPAPGPAPPSRSRRVLAWSVLGAAIPLTGVAILLAAGLAIAVAAWTTSPVDEPATTSQPTLALPPAPSLPQPEPAVEAPVVEPAQPEPAPAALPAPAPEPIAEPLVPEEPPPGDELPDAPPVPEVGWVSVVTDGLEVALRQGVIHYATSDDLRPGTYVVRVRKGRKWSQVGEVTVRAGETTRVVCNSALLTCGTR